ncbi:MAG: phosphoesterase [Desulfobacteraceae bacterium]|nr:MAG: phosphoesterase [Desulfobacteraceae bacterium]
MKNSAAKKLEELYKVFDEGDNILIVVIADPDSMASALAFKRLMWRRVASITISNVNVVDRPDNIAMIRLLGIRMTHINDIKNGSYNRFVMLDSQPGHNEIFSRFRFDAVIDHHPDSKYASAFSDIRPLYGATASIMTEYVIAAKIKPSVKLATALFHAIKTDTCDFERKAIVEDMKAFQFLFKYANLYLARKIEQSEIRLSQLKYYQKALAGIVVHKGKLFCHLGTVENPDICVNIADFFLKIESVQWSIVSGTYNDLLVIIFRNDGIRKNAGAVSSNIFGSIGSAGGHKSAARAEIPLAAVKAEIKPYNAGNLLNWIMKKVH